MKGALLALAFVVAACGQSGQTPNGAGYGPNPTLPAPQSSLIPTVNAARAVGWPAHAAPRAPAGFIVTRYAERLDHPRWIYTLPNGDVLIAESSTQPSRGGGVEGWVENAVQQHAGALGQSANRIVMLRDDNRDGVVDSRYDFAEDLNQPFGMALLGDHLYVANTDSVVRFRYTPGAVRAPGRGALVIRLPYREGDNGHWTRTLAAAPDGSKLYVSVGSSSNIADHGMAAERNRAAIWEINPDGSGMRIYASGLRNAVGLEFEPHTGQLWTTVNERDMLGDNLVPDFLTHVVEGGFYGWPYSYWGRHVDARVPQNPALVATALAPDFALGAHTASLGLHFYRGTALPEHYRKGAFIGQHGSWNRSRFVGYKVIFVPFVDGRPSGPVEDFLTGFLNARNEAQGRPVGIGEDATGALLVADDVGDIIWRVALAASAER
jgi:glucose/arabinose dehydrogenase